MLDAALNAFLDLTRAKAAWARQNGGDLVEAALADGVKRAHEAWPDLDCPDEAFLAAIARCVAEDEPSPATLARVHFADLYVACACAGGSSRAIAKLEQRFFDDVRAALRRLRLSPSDMDEAIQNLRKRLFVGTQGGPAKIASFTGRGPLLAWLRVVAIRDALKARSRGKREIPTEDDDRLFASANPLEHPELAELKAKFGPLVKKAFAEALHRLTDRDKSVLRFHYLDEVTLERIAAIYGVHRATAARWIQGARHRVVAHVREALVRDAGLAGPECESILRLVQSQFDLTFSGILKGASLD